MIRFSLACPADHAFESWFQSGAAFDALLSAGHVNCPSCGSVEIRKSLMAPAVAPARKAAKPAGPGALSAPSDPREEALKALRREMETNSDYVGSSFALEARRIHDGDAPQRAIYGEAKLEDARKLLEDGVPVMPLPFLPARKAN
jgi:hypothetical protein